MLKEFFTKRCYTWHILRAENKPWIVKLMENFPYHRNFNMDVEPTYFETMKVFDGIVVKGNRALRVAYFGLVVPYPPPGRRPSRARKSKTCVNCIGGTGV